jgi:hypothetical protein
MLANGYCYVGIAYVVKNVARYIGTREHVDDLVSHMFGHGPL